METVDIEILKYPIGKFNYNEYDLEAKNNFIETISSFPNKIIEITKDLTDSQLETPYRPGGWTIRQVVHHCADSHMNAFIRFKLALTEEKPTVKAYEEQLWAVQPDYKLPLTASLNIIAGLHARWVALLNSMEAVDFEAKYIHPQTGKELDLKFMLPLYAWHCEHHLAHIRQALAKN